LSALDLLGAEGLERDVRRNPKRVGSDSAELALTAAVTAVEAAHASIPRQRALTGDQRERIAALVHGLERISRTASLPATAESLELVRHRLQAESTVLDGRGELRAGARGQTDDGQAQPGSGPSREQRGTRANAASSSPADSRSGQTPAKLS
jgi:hypothetical protein